MVRLGLLSTCMHLLLLCGGANVSAAAPKVGRDQAISCHCHSQWDQELQISSIMNGLVQSTQKTPITATLFPGGEFLPGGETLQERPKLCCLLGTQPGDDDDHHHNEKNDAKYEDVKKLT